MDKFYELLEVTPFSSISEIKHSFREKAKNLHPDVQGSKGSETTERMRELLEAYKYILEKHKTLVEKRVFENKKRKEFNYRSWLLEQEDYESRAKLIVFDLFHSNEKAAVEEYLRLLSLEKPFYFFKFFSRNDFMDFGFVLAEEAHFLGHNYEAFLLLKDIFELETEAPYFKHFFPEVKALTKKTLQNLKPNTYSLEKIIQCYTLALNLKFTKREKKSLQTQLSKLMVDG